MVYNLKRLSFRYIRGFNEFLRLHNLSDWTPEQRYNLLSYAVSRLYGLESSVYSRGTANYGRSCQKYLSLLERTPKRIDKIPFSEKVQLLSMVQAYYVSTIVVAGKQREVVLDGD